MLSDRQGKPITQIQVTIYHKYHHKLRTLQARKTNVLSEQGTGFKQSHFGLGPPMLNFDLGSWAAYNKRKESVLVYSQTNTEVYFRVLKHKHTKNKAKGVSVGGKKWGQDLFFV